MQKEPVRRAYPKDASEEQWWFVLPYLCLLPENCGPRVYPLREVFNALRYVAWAGGPWRGLPHDLPPWVERTFGWIARCRRLARDYERLPHPFTGLHWLMFSGLLLARLHFQSFVSSL